LQIVQADDGIEFHRIPVTGAGGESEEPDAEPNLRISEIAYQVGFQSLTHFNRVFKRITGQSPTGYRMKLPNFKTFDGLNRRFAPPPGLSERPPVPLLCKMQPAAVEPPSGLFPFQSARANPCAQLLKQPGFNR